MFDERGVSMHYAENGRVPKVTWTLSDASTTLPGLPIAFHDPAGHVIYTSSPVAHCHKEWSERLGAVEYIMDVWSQKELRVLLALSDLGFKLGMGLSQKFEPSLKTIIRVFEEPLLENIYSREIRKAAAAFAANFGA
ncbi:hypothetical protein CPB84DRAFT_282071 [Gymnopilus junonius]|uniref:Uncharacterized protein n=1 Tax=Gymnopilus junonius TaxID=109634 RepID=A0A9P5NCC9_GYMJU|nr:hypothetical protein CPB84DRAFT_282071 [Gymnopilus junonius]